jgi:hypothetical protein
MRHTMQVIGLCLTTFLAVGAVAGSATALPPSFLSLFECQTINNAKSYWKMKMTVPQGNNCLEYDISHASNYEPVPTTGQTPEPSEKVPLTSTGGAKLFTTAEGLKVECETDQITGELLGSQHMPTTIRYAGCEMPLVGECTTPGQEKGVIQTNELMGSLFAIKESEPKEAGVFLTANTNMAPATFSEFECGIGTRIKVLSITKEEGETLNDKKTHSCLAGKLEPVNKLVGEGKLVLLKEGTKQGIKTVKYNEHEFECELEAEITFLVKVVERASQEDVSGNGLLAEEPWELML